MLRQSLAAAWNRSLAQKRKPPGAPAPKTLSADSPSAVLPSCSINTFNLLEEDAFQATTCRTWRLERLIALTALGALGVIGGEVSVLNIWGESLSGIV